MKRTVLLMVFVWSALAQAQLDPKAQPFLDAYAASFETLELPDSAPKSLETLDMTMCMTFGAPDHKASGSGSEETCTRSAIDMKNRRLMVSTSGEYGTKTVYRDGKVRMKFEGLGEQELPKNMVKALEKQLEGMFEQFQDIFDGSLKVGDFSKSRYDGPVRYGHVLAGEAVTVTMTMPSFGVGAANTKPTAVKLIFNNDKAIVGVVSDTPQGESLMVYTNPKSSNLMERFMSMTYYDLEGKHLKKVGDMRVTHYAFNEPLEESLFTLKPAP